MALKRQVKQGLRELDEELLIYCQQHICIGMMFHLHNTSTKDLDNITKFLLDALEGASCYNDNCFIFDLHLSKYSRDVPKTL